jgi:hypothetical protein
MKHHRILYLLVIDLADQIQRRHPELERQEALRRATSEIALIVPHADRDVVRALAS